MRSKITPYFTNLIKIIKYPKKYKHFLKKCTIKLKDTLEELHYRHQKPLTCRKEKIDFKTLTNPKFPNIKPHSRRYVTP